MNIEASAAWLITTLSTTPVTVVVSQACIALFGVSAVALTQSTSQAVRRWASVFGLLGQPFWFYSALSSGNWGIFTLCLLYTAVWAKGFYVAWIAPPVWTTEDMLERALVVMSDDERWLASDHVASALTMRYMQMLTPGWASLPVEHSGKLRARLGIDPLVETPRDRGEKATSAGG